MLLRVVSQAACPSEATPCLPAGVGVSDKRTTWPDPWRARVEHSQQHIACNTGAGLPVVVDNRLRVGFELIVNGRVPIDVSVESLELVQQ